MDQLSFVVCWNSGKKPECVMVTDDKGEASRKFESLMGDSKSDQIRLFSGVTPFRRWSPSDAARIVAENNKMLAEKEIADASAEKNRLLKEVEEADLKAKEARAKLKKFDSSDK